MSAPALDLALRNLFAWSVQVGVLALAAAGVGRLAPVVRPEARLAFGQALLALVLLLPLVQPWTVATTVADTTLGIAPAPAAGVPAALARPGAHGLPLAPFGAALLAAGVCGQVARLALRLSLLRRVSRAARRLSPEPWLAALRDAVAPRASFALCAGLATPATCGARRPLVLLPPSFVSMPRERQRAVALHELLHARRGDWLALVAEEALTAVLFFHPAVHWLVDRVRLAREQVVDAEAVRRGSGRNDYLESLVDAARAAASPRAVPAASFFRQSHLRERVDLLLREVSMSRTRTAVHLTTAAIAALAAVSLSASALPLQSAPAPKAAAVAKAPEGHVNMADDVKAPSEPKIVRRVNPVYPPEAKTEGVEGLFLIDIVIGKDGSIRQAEVVASAAGRPSRADVAARAGTAGAVTGDTRLARAALDAVRQWTYEPILKDGKPVEAKATVTVAFKLS
jgi:beta-lactamase regulating signal transducer with metallopeptidase domain